MSQAARIAMVTKHRQHLEKKAARKLGSANAELSEASHTLNHLDQHRRGYQAKLMERARGGMSAAELRRQLLFLRSLGDAVDSQREQVQSTEDTVGSLRSSWVDRHRDTETMSRLENKLRADEATQSQRREASEQDDRWHAQGVA